ncbi:MAG TPA: SAM-dependent chlorinase/fluorinase [Thermoanaerobaculia bacterium]|nr:SAM-dependent chlorinase/fluorinase [Thermoanaerobaculia bacterium]
MIALLTDFGTRDPYVAAMKGVIASRCDAAVHDVTHDIAPFDVFGAAWFLRAVASYWPRGTIFVCVVDPGVGTSRQIVALEHEGRIFVAPDNGLLTFASIPLERRAPSPAEFHATDSAGEAPAAPTVFAVTNDAFFLPHGSDTFHGRDRFAPVAAAIANGIPLAELGPPMPSLVRLQYDSPQYGESVVRGTIVASDRFGNLITDVERARIPFPRFLLRAHGVEIERLERTYGGAAPGPFLIVGSTGCIEISVANASAAERLQLRRLDRVELWPNDAESSSF